MNGFRSSNTRQAGYKGFPFNGNPYAKLNIKTLTALFDIQDTFGSVPLDKYVDDMTRDKDLARFMVRNGIVTKTLHGPLVHAINAGAYGDRATRTYEEIPLADIDPLKPVIEFFTRVADIKDGQEILLQRQRVRSSGNRSARTVQEGAHRDGVEKLAIFCADRMNISGGTSFLLDDQHNVVFENTLEPGDMLFIDDKALFHDTSPIHCLDANQPGHRDVVLLTWPSDRGDDHTETESEEFGYYGA